MDMFTRLAKSSIAGWLLVLTVLAHMLIPHHEGAELIFCLKANGEIAVETPSHVHEHGHADHEHHCEHEGGCHDIHLSLNHPDSFLGQQATEAQDSLKSQMAVLQIVLATVTLPAPSLILTDSREMPPPAQPPPQQFTRSLSTTVLLI